jgi:hypothetical protein
VFVPLPQRVAPGEGDAEGEPLTERERGGDAEGEAQGRGVGVTLGEGGAEGERAGLRLAEVHGDGERLPRGLPDAEAQTLPPPPPTCGEADAQPELVLLRAVVRLTLALPLGERVPQGDAEGEAHADGDAVTLGERVSTRGVPVPRARAPLGEPLPLTEGQGVSVRLPGDERDAEPLRDGDAVPEAVVDTELLTRGDAESEMVAQGEGLCVREPLTLPLSVGPSAHGESEGELEELTAAAEGVADGEPDTDAVAQSEEEAEGLREACGESVGDSEGLSVPVSEGGPSEGLTVPLTLRRGKGVEEPLLEGETAGVGEPEALGERLKVPLTDGEWLMAGEREGETETEGEPLPTGDRELEAVGKSPVGDADAVSVALPVREPLPQGVAERDARGVPVAGAKVGVDACVTLVVARGVPVAPVNDGEGAREALPLPVAEAQAVPLGVAVSRAVLLGEGVARAERERMAEDEGEPVAAPPEGVPTAPPALDDGESGPLRVARAGVAVAEPLPLLHALPLREMQAEGVAQPVAVGETLPESPPGPAEGLTDSVQDADVVPAPTDGVGNPAVSDGDREDVKDALPVGEGVAVRLLRAPVRVGNATVAVRAPLALDRPRGLPVAGAGEVLAVPDAAPLPVAQLVGDIVSLVDAEAEPDTVTVAQEVAEWDGEWLPLSPTVGVCEVDVEGVAEKDAALVSVAPSEVVTDRVPEVVEVMAITPLGVSIMEREPEALAKGGVGEAITEAVCVTLGEALPVEEAHTVTVGEAEADSAEVRVAAPVTVGVAEPQGLAEAVSASEGVPLPPVGDAEEQPLPDTLRRAEADAVGDAEPEGHGETVCTTVGVTVGEGVIAEVRDTEAQMVPVPDTEDDSENVTVRVRRVVPVPAPANEAVSEALPDSIPLLLAARDGVTDGEALTLGHPESVAAAVGVSDAEPEPVGALETLLLTLPDAAAVPLMAPLAVALGVAEAVGVREPPPPRTPGPPPDDGEPVPLTVPALEALPVAAVEGDRLYVVVTVNVLVTDAEEDTLCDTEEHAESDADGDIDKEAVPHKELVPESERLPVAHADSEAAAEPVLSAVVEGVPDSVARGDTEPVEIAVPLLVSEGNATVPLGASDAVTAPEVDAHNEGGCEADALPLAERVLGGERVFAAHATVGVPGAEPLGEPLPVVVKVASGDAEEDTVAVPDAEEEGEPDVVRVWFEVREFRGDAEVEPVSEGEGVMVAERVALPEAEGVGVVQRVADVEGVSVSDTDPEPEKEGEGVTDGHPEDVASPPVAVTLAEPLPRSELLTEGERVTTGLGDTEIDGDLVISGDLLTVEDTEGELEGEGEVPALREASQVADPENVAPPVTVAEEEPLPTSGDTVVALLRVGTTVVVGVPERESAPVALVVGVPDDEAQAVWALEIEADTVPEPTAVPVRTAVGLTLAVMESEAAAVSVAAAEPVTEGACVTLTVLLREPLMEDVPHEQDEGERETRGELEMVPVPVPSAVTLALCVTVISADLLTVDDFDAGGEREEDPQLESDAEREGDTEVEADRVARALPVPSCVGLSPEDALRVRRGEEEGDASEDALAEKHADCVSEAVTGVTLGVPETHPVFDLGGEGVVEGDTAAVIDPRTLAVRDGVAVPVFSAEALADAHAVPDGASVASGEYETDTEPDSVLSAPSERLARGEKDSDSEPDCEGQGVEEGDAAPLAVPQNVAASVRDAVEDTVAVELTEGVRTGDADTVEEPEPAVVAEPLNGAEGVTVAEGETLLSLVAVGEGDSDPGGVPEGTPDAVAKALAVALVVADTVWEPDAVGERVATGEIEASGVVVPVGNAEREAEGEPEARVDAEGELDGVVVSDGRDELLVEALPEGAAEPLRVLGAVRVADADAVPETEGLLPSEGVGALELEGGAEGDTSIVRDAAGERDALPSGDPVKDAEAQPEGEPG